MAEDIVFVVGFPLLLLVFGRLLFRDAYYGRHRVATRVGAWGLLMTGCTAIGLPFIIALLLLFGGLFGAVELERMHTRQG